jgi:TPR repeat protein
MNKPYMGNKHSRGRRLIKAANKGDMRSQYMLGQVYLHSCEPGMFSCYNIPKDIEEGIEYLILSANQGCEDAANSLGHVYGYNECGPEHGCVVDIEQDYRKAYEWFNIAKNNIEKRKMKELIR